MSWLGSKSVQYCVSGGHLFVVLPDLRLERRLYLEVAQLVKVDLLEEGVLHDLFDAVLAQTLGWLGDRSVRL